MYSPFLPLLSLPFSPFLSLYTSTYLSLSLLIRNVYYYVNQRLSVYYLFSKILTFTVANLYARILRRTEEEMEYLSFRIVDWHFTRIAGNPDFERRKSREIRTHSRGFWLEPSVEILSSKERGHLSLVRVIVAILINKSIFEYCATRNRFVFRWKKKRKKKNF